MCRTPLALISGPINDLAASELDPARKRTLDLAVRNSARLKRLVDTLLDVTSADVGKLEVRSEA